MSTDEGPVAWLRAAITERLELARKATQAPWEAEGDDPTDDEVWIDVEGEGWRLIICRGPQSHENMLYIAANDPRDTIARCEAELAILDMHARVREMGLYGEINRCVCQESSPVIDPCRPCRTVRLLLSGYRFRPGWRESWVPR